jgi:holin-like protein
VTIAVVLVYVVAFANVLVGTLVLLSRYSVETGVVLAVSLLGAAIILVGLLLVAVASGIARGSRLSRILATVYLGILMSLHLVTLLTTDGWDWSAAVQFALGAFVLTALWAPPAMRHFAREAPVSGEAGSGAP